MLPNDDDEFENGLRCMLEYRAAVYAIPHVDYRDDFNRHARYILEVWREVLEDVPGKHMDRLGDYVMLHSDKPPSAFDVQACWSKIKHDIANEIEGN